MAFLGSVAALPSCVAAVLLETAGSFFPAVFFTSNGKRKAAVSMEGSPDGASTCQQFSVGVQQNPTSVKLASQ
jgi:hypothetical protein